jgi:Bifunctional DNA primase/polymerase, N-terminal.
LALKPSKQFSFSEKTINQAVDWYIKNGLVPLPAKHKSKQLNFKTDEWNLNKKPTINDINKWKQEKRYQNIALLCGTVGNNLTVIDIDKTDYIPWDYIKKQTIYNNQKIGYIIKTHRGLQLWFKNKPYNYDRNEKISEFEIEYFTEKHIVIAPPSIHPKGTPYTFLQIPEYFRQTDVHFIWNLLKVYCISHDIDHVLKPIMNPLIKQKIVTHLQNTNCSHNDRLWMVGFLYTTLHLQKNDILELIKTYGQWTDYNSGKTENYVSRQLQYIDKKVGEKGGKGA